MTKLFMCIGLPASGKSEQAKKLAAEYNAEIFSSDELRVEMFGDVNHQENNNALFNELHKRIRECLASGKSAIYDACNINYKRRMEFLKSLNKISCEKIAVIMATHFDILPPRYIFLIKYLSVIIKTHFIIVDINKYKNMPPYIEIYK